MPAIEYGSLYDSYWSRPDRAGSHSFENADALAEQILCTCGAGPVLDAGCGMGLLVQTLLTKGIDARGVDVSPVAVAAANARCPGRFQQGSILSLPFADGEFETVVSTDVFEHLAEEDVPDALAELARVARSTLFLKLSTAPDRDKTWHLTVRDRGWWENACFRAGLRKHPLSLAAVPYSALEHEGHQITIVLEKIPPAALSRWPLESLAAGRGLHMDMLRETGRRSDAHLARYALACQSVRPGDTVLDAACGLGYGSAMLAAGAPLAKCIGVDLDADAVEYARANFAASNPRLEFRAGDAADLSWLPDRSVDAVVSFETLEHIPDPARLLAEFARVLTPGGRLIVSVPNDWTDETGQDPNPHHLHVYTWGTLAKQLTDRFVIEKAYAQTAGGGMKLADRPRAIAEAPLDRSNNHLPLAKPDTEAEWWLSVALLPLPLGGERKTKSDYRETAYPNHRDLPGFHVAEFARDYDNPWLVRTIVSIGLRASDPAVLEQLARGALAEARPGSADQGAALCVLAYRELARDHAAHAEGLLCQLADYDTAAEDTAHAHRWRISNLYAAAKLRLKLGRRSEAEDAFRRCVKLDCTRFSPLLASKTVDAWFQLGVLRLSANDPAAARADWVRGLEEAGRALHSPWTNVWGTPEHPLTFGLPEVALVADTASRCSYAIDALDRFGPRSGKLWHASQTQTLSDAKRWAAQLSHAKAWLEKQVNGAPKHDDLRAYISELEHAKDWAEQQTASWKQELAAQTTNWQQALATSDAALHEVKSHLAHVELGKSWLESQLDAHRADHERLRAAHDELKAWADQVVTGKSWLEGQYATLNEHIRRIQNENADLQARAGALEAANAELRAELAAQRERTAQIETRAVELKLLNAQIERSREWLEGERRAWRAKAEELAPRPGGTDAERATDPPP